MHWGTFQLTDEPMDEPPIRLKGARKSAGINEDQFFVMKHGETINLNLWMYYEHSTKISITKTILEKMDEFREYHRNSTRLLTYGQIWGRMSCRSGLSDTLQGHSMSEMFGNILIFLGANFSHTIWFNWKSDFVEIWVIGKDMNWKCGVKRFV